MQQIPEFVKGEIYLLLNTENNKKYIGQTTTHQFKTSRNKWYPFGSMGRWHQHINEAFSNKSTQCTLLNNAIKKYGVEKFDLKILETCDVNDTNDRESYYIKFYDSFENGYNLTKGGDFGGKHAESVYERISETQSNMIDETRVIELIKIKDTILKVHIDDVTIGCHGVRLSITTSNDRIVWIFTNRKNDLWKLFMRAYHMISKFVSDEIITVDYRLVHYLDTFETSLYAFLLPTIDMTEKSNGKEYNIQKRFEKYNSLDITHVTLKLIYIKNVPFIGVCIRKIGDKREMVSIFHISSPKNTINSAILLAKMLTSDGNISIRPELLAFLNQQQITLDWIPAITRKQRNVFNKH